MFVDFVFNTVRFTKAHIQKQLNITVHVYIKLSCTSLNIIFAYQTEREKNQSQYPSHRACISL